METNMNNRGVSLMAEQLAFPLVGGGSTPTTPLHIRSCHVSVVNWETICPLLREFHYRGTAIGGSVRVCLGLYTPEGRLIGGAAIGDPRHAEAYGGTRHQITELRRLVCHDDAPKNIESYFVGKILWWLKKWSPYLAVLSYADTSVGHVGTIYKASNFSFVGKTAASQMVESDGRKYHMRSLTVNRPYAKELKAKVERGEATVVTGGEKNAYIYWLKPKP